MNRKSLLFTFLTFILLFPSYSMAVIIRVPDDEASIQDASDNAEQGDTIRLSHGTYDESILIYNKFLTIDGDTTHPEEVIIRPPAGGSVIWIFGSINGEIALSGLTLTGGEGTDSEGVTYGGGICCQGQGAPSFRVTNCIIIDNTADVGGGIYSSGIHPFTSNCKIIGNSAERGGALKCEKPIGRYSLIGCQWTEISGNVSENNIIELDSVTQTFILRNCTITQNAAENDLISFSNSQIDVQGTILWGNDPGTINRMGDRSSLIFRYSLVQGGQQAVSGRIEQWSGTMLTISPEFVDPDNDLFALRRSSPCIDRGYPYGTLDFDGTVSDMGSHPYIHQRGIVVSLVSAVNGAPITDAELILSTPRNFEFPLENKGNGKFSLYSFQDNANGGTFSLTISHPHYIDKLFTFQSNGEDTTRLYYFLEAADFDYSPQPVSIETPQGTEADFNLNIINNSNSSFRWALQTTGDFSVLQELNITQYGHIGGAAFDGEYFYLPDNYANGDRQIFVLDRDGQLVRSFPQSYQGGVGIVDIEYDGSILWAVGDRRVYQFSVDGDHLGSWSIAFTGIAITYDSSEDLIWITGSLTSSYAFDVNGNRVGDSVVRNLRMNYGLAYVDDDPESHNLYMLVSGDDINSRNLVRIDPATRDTIMFSVLSNWPDRELLPGVNRSTLWDEDGVPVWFVQAVTREGEDSTNVLSVIRFDSDESWLVPKTSKGYIVANSQVAIPFMARSVLGATDTLGIGNYRDEIIIAFDLPSETLTIPIQLNVGVNGVEDSENSPPETFRLEAPFPNPFNSKVTINYGITVKGHLRLDIVDINGRLVENLIEGEITAGDHKTNWSASGYATGTYIARLTTEDGVRMAKLLLLR